MDASAMTEALVRWHVGPIHFFVTRLGFPSNHDLEFDFSTHPDFPGAWMIILSVRRLWITLGWRVRDDS